MVSRSNFFKVNFSVLVLSFVVLGNVYTANPWQETIDDGNRLIQDKKFDEAIVVLTQFINANKMSANKEMLSTFLEVRGDAYLKLAWSGKGNKNFELAIDNLNKAEPQQIQNGWHFQRKGWAYSGVKDYDQALLAYGKASELLPPEHKGFAYFGRGQSFSAKGSIDYAIAEYNKALQLDPKNADAYYERGLLFAQKGELDKAIADYTETIVSNPALAKAYNSRAIASYQKKDYTSALNDVREAKKHGLPVNAQFLAALEKASGKK